MPGILKSEAHFVLLIMFLLGQPEVLFATRGISDKIPYPSENIFAFLPEDYWTTGQLFETQKSQTIIADIPSPVATDLSKATKTKDKTESEKIRQANKYRRAAKRGYALAQYNLGVCYENGEGVIKDKTLAISWYCMAAEQGYAAAKAALKRLGVE